MVQADTSLSFNSPALISASKTYINSTDGNSDTYHTLANAYFGKTYYWRVRARNSVDTSAWSTVKNLVTRDYVNLTSPANGTSTWAGPTLDWQPHSGVAYYMVEVDTSSLFNSTALRTISKTYVNSSDGNIDTQWDITDLYYGKKYYWRVRASNSVDTCAWSEVRDFITRDFVTATSPAIGASTWINPTLDWAPHPGSDYYMLQADTTPNFNSPALIPVSRAYVTSTDGNSDSYYTLPNAYFGKTYYWRVCARNSVDTSAWSTVRTLVTRDYVTLSTPNYGQLNVASAGVTLEWAPHPGISVYQCQFDTVNTFDSPFLNTTNSNYINSTDGNTDTRKATGLLQQNKVYFWRVRAWNAIDTCAWTTRYFSTGSCGQPEAISGNDTVCEGSSNTYTLAAVTGATSYIWTLPSGWSGTSTTNSITTNASANGGQIKVRVNNNCGISISQTFNVLVTPFPTLSEINGDATICKGSSNTYSVDSVPGATAYTWSLPQGWSGSSTTRTNNVIPNGTNGSISVNASVACGTTASKSKSITVNDVPSITSNISGDTIVCQGNTQTYSISTIANATSYAWIIPSGWSGSSTSNTIDLTFGNASDTLYVQASNACGDSQKKKLYVGVNTIPTFNGAIDGAETICEGTTATYSIKVSDAAASCAWTLPSGWTGTSTTASIDVTANQTGGSILVQATNICGTSSPSDAKSISVVLKPATPIITVVGDIAVCAGSTTTLSSSVASGETMSWHKNTKAISGANGTTLIVSDSGNYAVMAINTNGCSSMSANQHISLLPSPQASISSSKTAFCPGSESIALTANTDANAGYQWMKDNSLSNAFTSTINATSAGTYKAILSYINGCTDTSNTITLTTAETPTATLTAASNEFCIGASTTISANALTGATYNWFESGVKKAGPTASNTYAVNVIGTYTVEVINAQGCKDTSEPQVITSKTLPATTITSSVTKICSGGSALLSAQAINGATYEWFRNNVTLGVPSTSNTYTATLGGTYKYTVNDGCSATSSTLTLTENTPPGAAGTIYGPSSYCSGETGDYYIYAVSGADSYTWEITPSTAASITSGQGTTDVVIAFRNVNAQIKVTPVNSCGSGQAKTLNVTHDNTFCGIGTVLFDGYKTNICSGNSVLFTNYTDESFMFGATANWNFGSGAAPATATGRGPHTVTYNTSGYKTVTLEYKDQFGFSMYTKTKTDFVNVSSNTVSTSAISSSITTNCPTTETFAVTNSIGSTYAWTVPAGAAILSGQGSNQITVNFNGQLGTVSVTETTASGCVGTTKSMDVDCNVLATNILQQAGNLYVYPNPTSGLLYVESATTEQSTYTLTNMAGQQIMLNNMQIMQQGTRQLLDVSTLANGMYILNIKNNKNSVNIRIVKQ